MALALYSLVDSKQKTGFKVWLLRALPFIMIVGLYLVFRYLFFGDPGGYRVQGISVHRGIIPDYPFRTMVTLAQGLFFPLNFLYVGSLPTFVGVIAVVTAVVFLVFSAKSLIKIVQAYPSLIALIILPILPILSHLGVTGEFKDARYFYLASPFIAMMMGVAFGRTKYFSAAMLVAVILLTVNVGAYIDAYRLTTKFNSQVDTRLSGEPSGKLFSFSGVPFSSNGVYIYGNGFAERFGLEKATAVLEGDVSGAQVVKIDLKTFATLGERRRNLSTFKLEGVYRVGGRK